MAAFPRGAWERSPVVAKLQAALDQLRKEGVVDEIMAKYL